MENIQLLKMVRLNPPALVGEGVGAISVEDAETMAVELAAAVAVWELCVTGVEVLEGAASEVEAEVLSSLLAAPITPAKAKLKQRNRHNRAHRREHLGNIMILYCANAAEREEGSLGERKSSRCSEVVEWSTAGQFTSWAGGPSFPSSTERSRHYLRRYRY